MENEKKNFFKGFKEYSESDFHSAMIEIVDLKRKIHPKKILLPKLKEIKHLAESIRKNYLITQVVMSTEN